MPSVNNISPIRPQYLSRNLDSPLLTVQYRAALDAIEDGLPRALYPADPALEEQVRLASQTQRSIDLHVRTISLCTRFSYTRTHSHSLLRIVGRGRGCPAASRGARYKHRERGARRAGSAGQGSRKGGAVGAPALGTHPGGVQEEPGGHRDCSCNIEVG